MIGITKGVLCATLLLVSAFLYAGNEDVSSRAPSPVAAFSLTDQYGNPYGLEQLKGQWSLLVLGFTSCPDVCPMTLLRLEAIRAQLGMRMMPDKIPKIVFIAVDRDRDESVLAAYLAHFHPDYVGITGDDNELTSLVDSIGGLYRIEKRFPGDNAYNVRHSAGVAVVNPKGEWVATLNPPFHSHRSSEFLVQVIRDGNAKQQARLEQHSEQYDDQHREL
ncbi:SCO family protein [Ketobacter sp.]|uniref:SCO family protein n=1 Tax=Ketobacter sp. TaxID=2083498 RepID=UPI000F14BE47|nr:SCO family protein [Ketobacter sp.]RLT97355.1 MAG: SCO family protein [Ketobacter sp.]